MAKAKNTDVLEVLAALGISPEDLAEAVGTAQVRERKTIKVDVLTGDDARQYGDVSISKAVSGGRYIAKLGVFADDLDGFIEDLQAARDALAS